MGSVGTKTASTNRVVENTWLGEPDRDRGFDWEVYDINPGYFRTLSDEYRRNCAMCTVASELNTRGYAVEAMPRDETWRGVPNVFEIDYYNPDNFVGIAKSANDIYYHAMGRTRDEVIENADAVREHVYDGKSKSFTRSAERNRDIIISQMKHWGNGATAELMLKWKGGKKAGSHSVYVVNNNGNVAVVNSQTGRQYTGRDITTYISDAIQSKLFMQRLDNAKLRSDIPDIQKIVKKRGN